KKSAWITGPTAFPSITSSPAPAAPGDAAAKYGATTGRASCAWACASPASCAPRPTASCGASRAAPLLPPLRCTGAAMPRLLLGGIGGALALAACAALAAPRLADFPGNKAANSVEVDVELVMAVDISYSMDMDELA